MKTVQTKIPNKEKKSHYYKMHSRDILDLCGACSIVAEYLEGDDDLPFEVASAIEDLRIILNGNGEWSRL